MPVDPQFSLKFNKSYFQKMGILKEVEFEKYAFSDEKVFSISIIMRQLPKNKGEINVKQRNTRKPF